MAKTPNDTCWTILHAASAGDAAARSVFSRRYESTVREYLCTRWARGPLRAEVDDATQDVFVECLKPGGALERTDRDQGEFRGLLFAVVRNVARRFEERAVEKGRVRPEDSAWMERIASDEPGQATLFDRSWARSILRQAKARHLELAREEGEGARRRFELLERRFGDEQAIRDIAAHWGVDAREVHNAYRKARAEFYRCLREVVAFHAPAGADLDAECENVLAALR